VPFEFMMIVPCKGLFKTAKLLGFKLPSISPALGNTLEVKGKSSSKSGVAFNKVGASLTGVTVKIIAAAEHAPLKSQTL
jgi:hypothetical protein